jgi:hypothetical protein
MQLIFLLLFGLYLLDINIILMFDFVIQKNVLRSELVSVMLICWLMLIGIGT